MKITALFAAIAAGALAAFSWNPAGQDSTDGHEAAFAFTGAHVVHPAQATVLRDQVLLIDDGEIISVQAADRNVVGRARRTIDLGGQYVMPGLWDSHVHLGDNIEDIHARIFPALIARGVTHVRDMGSTLAAMKLFKEAGRAPTPAAPGPTIIASGPLLDGQALDWYRDLQLVVAVPERVPSELARLDEAGVDFFKVYSTLAPDTYAAILDEAARLGVPVDGHVPARVGLAAVAAGQQRTIEHLDIFTLQSCASDGESWFRRGLGARFGDGPAAYAEIVANFWDAVDWGYCGAALKQLGAREAGWVPTLIMEAFSQDNVSEADLAFASPVTADWCRSQLEGVGETPPEDRRRALEGLRDAIRRIKTAGLRVIAGTDFPNNCSIPGVSVAAELELLFDAGMSPAEALAAATSNPAEVFGVEPIGRLEAGYVADFIVLAENPLESIEAVEDPVGVFTRGVWYDADSLSLLAKQARRAAQAGGES